MTPSRDQDPRSIRSMAPKSLLIVVVALFQLVSVDSSATFEVYMLKYRNPTERRSDGKCCDPFCSGKCDPKFYFCLDRYRNPTNTDSNVCSYAKKTTGYYKDYNDVTFGSYIKGVRNPITITNIGKENVVVFKAKVIDIDTKYDDHIDSFHEELYFSKATTRYVAQWRTKTVYGRRRSNKSRFYIKYRAYCNTYYYGSDCNVYCKAQNSDRYGHYRCDIRTGRKICLSGWIKPENLCRVKANPCTATTCYHGGTCVGGSGTYTCTCTEGYIGDRCETYTGSDAQAAQWTM